MSEAYDMVVVGSGWFGLGAARAYLETHPSEKIVVFESNESVGGTWSEHRLYPGLKSNNMVGSYEFPDFPMSEEVYGVKAEGHIPGAVLHRYLTDFSRAYRIHERLQFQTTVQLVEPTTSGWRLTVESPQGQRQVETARLILATGLTSTPNMPDYKGSDSFGKPLFHAKDFCTRAPELEGLKNVVVVGGAKSAYDVAYAMVEGGAEVDLIIKPESTGPVWIAPRKVTPLKHRTDTILNVRFMSWFSPCPWGAEDGYGAVRRFLNKTFIGCALTRGFWSLIGNDILQEHKYDNHPELSKLKPWNSVFWIGSGLSIYNYNTSLFDMVRAGKIRVHIENVDHLEAGIVVLESGQSIKADAIVCSTGWKKESTLKFAGLDEQALGLPFSEELQTKLNREFDGRILEDFPILKDQPQLRFQRRPAEPLRYYRFMVPPGQLKKRNIAFAGMISSVSTAICATAQGIWISAFMDGKLEREAKTQEEITQEIMLHTQWGKWRYPCGYGASLPDLVFEGIPYTDMLLKDLGIKSHRKPSLYKELTQAYAPADYNGVMDEWKAKSGTKTWNS
ncbi:putative flavin-binding monooxygenase-like protein [Phaeoacremonium minimum UCRPA7]|uniref:Putative flavin-binding monooxygenase-like protein n=1 Tax=Phaeoacremonium minimum (strain UCR-PA7) TaxID=1286976 RepID=R8BDD5_PHAM7|nr:putative flavin-binding monooxygenase-like protein [Phaeoacremonium minimum UCRPA7]EON97304.1 putative flavin-binding monooxygenase-like protein [Phaeoacremonium minimum UCRPA7]